MLSNLETKPYEFILWLAGFFVALWIFGLLGFAVVVDTNGPPWYVGGVGFWITSLLALLLLGVAKTAKEVFWCGTLFAGAIMLMCTMGYFFVSWLLV